MSSKSSFNGVITEIPGISVDNFESSLTRSSRAYFLSHCHSDHTQGLDSGDLMQSLKLTNANIYMSEHTKAIIKDDFGDKFTAIEPYMRSLKSGSELITLPATSNLEELIVNVSLIPAGHCFGSVMFLFETDSITVLFTGDFRVDTNDVRKLGYLHNKNKEPKVIDVMYVDTTFIGDMHSYFPKRSESIENVLKEIKRWCGKSKDNMIALHTSAKYGYEFVFNEIFEKLNMKVYANDYRWKFYRSMLHLVPGVTNEKEASRIHICTNRHANVDHKKCFSTATNTTDSADYLYIHFSALKWIGCNDEVPTLTKDGSRVDVCFATHCSRSEIINFVSYFSPKTVVGFPNAYVCEEVRVSDVFGISPPPVKRKKAAVIDDKVDVEILKDLFGLTLRCVSTLFYYKLNPNAVEDLEAYHKVYKRCQLGAKSVPLP